MAFLSESTKAAIAETKIKAIFNGLSQIKEYIPDICDMRPEQYLVKRTEWLQMLKQISETLNQRSYFLFIGLFSSGKSSFINSLLGIDLLPTASVPCTAVVTEVSFTEEKVRKGSIVYQDGSVEIQDQDTLYEIIKGKKSLETGSIHHIELNININELGINSESFKPLIGKVTLVDCPGFESPYGFSEEILYEYVDKASFTFYLMPSDKFGGIKEINRLTDLKKRTSTLIPLISKSDKIEDEEAKEDRRIRFEETLSGKFEHVEPIFVSTFIYKEYSALERQLAEKKMQNQLTDEENDKLNQLLLDSGIPAVFNQIGMKSKNSELNRKKIESVIFDFNTLVDDMYKAALIEGNYWDSELKRLGYNKSEKTYTKLELSRKAINGYIADQSREVGTELKRRISSRLAELIYGNSNVVQNDIKNVFSEEYEMMSAKYTPIWKQRFREYYDEITITINVTNPDFKIPSFDNLPMPHSHIPAGILDGIKTSGPESILLSIGAAALIVCSQTAKIAALTALMMYSGIGLGAYVGISNINPISDGIKRRKEKNEQKVQSKIAEIMQNESTLNFEETISRSLCSYRDSLEAQFKLTKNDKVNDANGKYQKCMEVIEHLDRIQNNLNVQVN